MPKITPFLWFDNQAEEAAKFYVSLFPNSRIVDITRYGEGGPQPTGTVMTVVFELDGQRIVALNGGPMFKLSEAFSLSIECKDQQEVDHFWNKLSAGGLEQPCGWLKDRFGLSWQVTPKAAIEMLTDPDPHKAQRATEAMMAMKKFDIAAMQRAYEGRA